MKQIPTPFVVRSLCAALLCALTATLANAQDFLVGEYFTSKVWRVSPDGTKTVFAQPSVPSGIRFFGAAFDASGNLYAARFQGGINNPGDPNNGVVKISPSGATSNFVSGSGLEPSDIAFDPSGNLYVSSYTNGTIRRFTPGGVDLGIFATMTGDAYKMSTGANGDLFVGSGTNGQIRRYSAAGANLGLVGTVSGFRSIQVAPNGEVFVGRSNGVISRFTPGGVSLGVFATLTGTDVFDMSFAPNGDLYTADGVGNTIHHISAAGVSLGTVGSGFATPSTITFLPGTVAVPEASSFALCVLPMIALSMAVLRRREGRDAS